MINAQVILVSMLYRIMKVVTVQNIKSMIVNTFLAQVRVYEHHSRQSGVFRQSRLPGMTYSWINVRLWSSLCENAADVAAGRRCHVDSGQILAQYPSGCDGFEDCLATPDIEDPGQVVGQYMQRHFG